jgi:hypothetical protein
MRIEFVMFPGCPHAAAARRVLDRVLAVAGVTDPVEEIDTTAPETPDHLRNWGSPTILINGLDFEGQAIPTAPSCRLYTDRLGRTLGAPSEMLLLAAVQRVQRGSVATRTWLAGPVFGHIDAICSPSPDLRQRS